MERTSWVLVLVPDLYIISIQHTHNVSNIWRIHHQSTIIRAHPRNHVLARGTPTEPRTCAVIFSPGETPTNSASTQPHSVAASGLREPPKWETPYTTNTSSLFFCPYGFSFPARAGIPFLVGGSNPLALDVWDLPRQAHNSDNIRQRPLAPRPVRRIHNIFFGITLFTLFTVITFHITQLLDD